MTHTSDPVREFMEAASVPRGASHASGTLERAEALLAAHPGVAGTDIYVAAVLGDGPPGPDGADAVAALEAAALIDRSLAETA